MRTLDVSLWLPVTGIALGQRFVFPGASIADVGLGIFAGLGLLHLARAAPRPPLPAWWKWLAALWTWAVVSGAIHVLLRTETFSALEFSKSLAKLTFYAAAVTILAVVLRDAPEEETAGIVLTAFAVAGMAAIAIYAAMLLGVPLPYETLWGHGPQTAYLNELRWVRDPGAGGRVFLRAQGLASEPSVLGYLQAMALGYLLLRPRTPPRAGIRLVLIGVSALLTFSLTAYALLSPIVALAALRRWRAGRRLARRRGMALTAAALLLLLPASVTVYRAVVVRASRALTRGSDVSSRLRVAGNWEMTYRLLETNPVLGVGLGNYDVMVRELEAFLFEGHLLEANTQGWNTFAYVLASTGVPGFLLFLAMLRSAFRGRGWLAMPFALGMFADGTFLGAAFWVFLGLYATDNGPGGSPPSPASLSARSVLDR